MPGTPTTRRKLPKIVSGDNYEVPADLGALADAVDNYQIDLFGLRANLPAVGSGNGQMSAEDDGTYYYCTDTHELLRYTHSAASWRGVHGGGRRSFISAEESSSSTTLSLLNTPDQVQNVVINSTRTLLYVKFLCLAKVTGGVSPQATMALFIGGNRIASPGGTAPNQQTTVFSNQGYTWFFTAYETEVGNLRIGTLPSSGDQAATSSVRAWGKPICIDNLAAGSYNINVQVSATAGSVVWMKERKLWVWTQDNL